MTKTVIIKEKTKNLVCNPSMTFANDICIRFLHFSTSWLKYHLDYVMLIEFASSEGLCFATISGKLQCKDDSTME